MSAPLPVAAFTVACGDAARREARHCEASFRHWHPDIPFLCIDERLYRLLAGGRPPVWSGELVSMRALAGWFLSRRVQRVIYLDTDLFVLGRLEHLVAAGDEIPTSWTADHAAYSMGLHDAPRINSGVLASSDPLFWQTWTAAQYGCLMPAVSDFYFNQLSLRLLAQAGAVRGRLIDGTPGAPFYNIAIRDQPGDWRVADGAVYKGAERALIFHQAGERERGIAAAPSALQGHLAAIVADAPEPGPAIDFEAWWADDGTAFAGMLRETFPTWPTITLDALLARDYARAPGLYRTVAPTAWDRHRQLEGTPWRRVWNHDWQAYLYHR
ncbi:MAG: hypothetical protein WDO13_04775 [Verrucomicrobiota bacterium]